MLIAVFVLSLSHSLFRSLFTVPMSPALATKERSEHRHELEEAAKAAAAAAAAAELVRRIYIYTYIRVWPSHDDFDDAVCCVHVQAGDVAERNRYERIAAKNYVIHRRQLTVYRETNFIL